MSTWSKTFESHSSKTLIIISGLASSRTAFLTLQQSLGKQKREGDGRGGEGQGRGSTRCGREEEQAA